MKTRIFNALEGEGYLPEVAKILNSDGIVAIPTETVYGLAASAYSDSAIKKVFSAKGRPQDNPLTILAEKAQLNKNYICKIFKESTGKTPIEYVNEIRIKNVCKELETGKKSIAQIASDNGYKDMSYFCKVFKKHTGITAKKYISQLGMDIE